MTYNGICYAPFPPGYDPSTANNNCLFFGSDMAQDAMAPLWHAAFTSSTGSSCGATPGCRNDLQTLKELGVNLIRLYDWEPRNRHTRFLDRCQDLGIHVLAPVSNYFLQDGFNDRDTLIPALIASFSNATGTSYHPAICGILIANEPELTGISADTLATFTNDWITREPADYAKVSVGHPVSFALLDGPLPCWSFWDSFIPKLGPSLNDRLFLAPQTYNDGSYLFGDAEGRGQGWVPLTWSEYQKPILFTEIGMDRTKPAYADVVRGQLQACVDYATSHPDRLRGACFFEFADKVWTQGTSEGSFGVFQHSGAILCSISYSAADFTHWEAGQCDVTMQVDVLEPSGLYNAVAAVYNGQGDRVSAIARSHDHG